jgi:hypothetical protein
MPSAYHLFRISVDTSYSTFPTADQLYVGGQATANTASDGRLAGAVWVDLGMTCGQCHQDATHQAAGVPKIPYAQLAAQANIIHAGVNGSPVLPPGAGVAVCTAVSLNRTIGSTTSTFSVGDNPASTINGGLSGQVYIDWGDGSALQTMALGATSSHTYANQGYYYIRKTVQDTEGFGISCYTQKEVQVSNLAPSGWGTFTLTAQTCATYNSCSNNFLKSCTTATVIADCDPAGALSTPPTCNSTGNVALANVNAYLVNGHLQFHGDTGAAGTVTLPSIANTMPSASYSMTVFAPQGPLTCYTNAGCTTPVNNPSTAATVTGSATVYCK